MQDSKLNPPLRKLGKHLENGSIVGSTPSTPAGNHARILDHHILEIRRRDPDALLCCKHCLHDLLVVLPIGEEAERNGAAHLEEHMRPEAPSRDFRAWTLPHFDCRLSRPSGPRVSASENLVHEPERVDELALGRGRNNGHSGWLTVQKAIADDEVHLVGAWHVRCERRHLRGRVVQCGSAARRSREETPMESQRVAIRVIAAAAPI